MKLDDRYELLDKIGSGSYATVYRARDKELGREVAIKQIHAQYLADPKTLERYWAEAQLLASLHHPNIVTIFDIVRERGWLIMELMQGSIKERLSGRQMDLRSMRAALAHCLRALHYLHGRGVIHGDIKPANMMIDHRKRVKLGDFGLARRVSDDEGSLLKGTAKYIAPEVVSDDFGEVGQQSDLYSLGFCAYELMCGSENFEDLFPGLSAFGRDKQAAWMMWHAAPDRKLPEIRRVLEGVPADLAVVVQKLIEKDPAHRYHTAEEALSDLKVDVRLVKSGGGDENDTAVITTADAPKSRRGLLITAFAISIALSLAMLFLPAGGPAKHTGAAQTRLGVVREVDASAATIEYEDPVSGIPALLKLPASPRILLLQIGAEQKYILPRDIEAGDWIEIQRGADAQGDEQLELTVSRPADSTGVLAAVDPGAHRLTLSVREGAERDDLSMQVPARAKLSLNGLPASLREFAADDEVRVRHVLDPAGKTGHIVSELQARRRQEFPAFVDHVDLDANTLTISFGRGATRVRVLPFADDAAIAFKSGETLAKSDLRPGDRLTVVADVAIRALTVLREDLQLAGTVDSIDAAGPTLVVSDAQAKRHAFLVGENTEVTLGLEPARLSDLRTEIDSVTISYSEDPDGKRHAASIDAHRGKRHDRRGLLIGTQAYVDSDLSQLPHATADAQLVYESLVNRYAMDADWATRLLDRNRDEAAREIELALAKVGTQHELIVYIAAHAYLDKDDTVYLAFADFRFGDMPRTGMPLDWLINRLEESSAKSKLLLLDLVHAGNGGDVARQPPLPDLLYKLKTPIRTVDIIGSSAAGQRSHNLPGDGHSLFAHVVARGYSGSADVNRDLHVTGSELYEFLVPQMAEARLPAETQQTPFRMEPSGG